MAQFQSYDFSIPRFRREFFENYVIPMGREGGNRDRKEMRVSLRRTIFGHKSNESKREWLWVNHPRLVFMTTLRFRGEWRVETNKALV